MQSFVKKKDHYLKSYTMEHKDNEMEIQYHGVIQGHSLCALKHTNPYKAFGKMRFVYMHFHIFKRIFGKDVCSWWNPIFTGVLNKPYVI